jgi:hypothetical protein
MIALKSEAVANALLCRRLLILTTSNMVISGTVDA